MLQGAGSALSIDSLGDAEELFLDRVDAVGGPIQVNPTTLVVSNQDRTLSRQLMNDTTILLDGASAETKITNTNPHVGKWDPMSTPYLTDDRVAAGTTGSWYLFANPDDVPAFTISFLNGNQTPMLESSETDFDVLGMSWRVIYDFGIDQTDNRGAVKSDGS